MLSKNEKELQQALRNGSLQEIKHVFGKSSEPLTGKEVVKVLRLLLGRSNFDFEMVQLLKKHHCDLNAPLGDLKTNPDQYRIGDYLASYGRLSPRLIDEMAKAGYDFAKTNRKGEHAGFYLIATKPINDKIIAALKSKGVDFSLPNNDRKTTSDLMVYHIKNMMSKMFLKTEKEVAIRRLSPLFKTQEGLLNLSILQGSKLKEAIDSRLTEIEPKAYETVGIQDILRDNEACCKLGYSVSHSQKEFEALRLKLRTSFIQNCPGYQKRLQQMIDAQNTHE